MSSISVLDKPSERTCVRTGVRTRVHTRVSSFTSVRLSCSFTGSTNSFKSVTEINSISFKKANDWNWYTTKRSDKGFYTYTTSVRTPRPKEANG